MRLWVLCLAATALIGGTTLRSDLFVRAPKSPLAIPLSRSGLDDIDFAAMDLSVDACEDFYQRACGGFISAAKLTPDQPEIEMSQQEFDATLKTKLAQLFTVPAPPNSGLGRLETFYSSCLDNDASNQQAVKQWLGRIDAARSRADIQSLILALSQIGVDPFFTYSGQPDPHKLNRYRGEIDSSYLWQQPDVVEQAFVLSGMAPAAARAEAQAVTSMVTKLRGYRNTSDNPKDYENPRTLAQIKRIAPAIDWRRYFALVGASPSRSINLDTIHYLPAVSDELTARSVADLRAYLRWSFLFSLRGELPAPYNQAFGRLSPALKVDLGDPRKRCRDAAVRAMGVEFSRQYSQRILGMQAREAATEISRSIRDKIVASVRDAKWLSPAARQRTMNKLQKTDLKIGFPDHWPAVGNYPLNRHAFMANVLSARKFEAQRAWQRTNRPRSRKDWEMIVYPWVGQGMAAARLVLPNGFPDADSNSLIMTAAFLNPPTFDASAAPELNYGSYGAVFAHEFVHIAETHQYDAEGREHEIWSPADTASWDKQRQCVLHQSADYGQSSGIKRPGAPNYHDYSENVADLGGLRLAYEALKADLGPRLNQRDKTGLTPAQRFFYKYAQHWCTATTPEELRKRAESDPHAPPEYRTNGPLSNLPGFAEAFSCKPRTPMRRAENQACRVW